MVKQNYHDSMMKPVITAHQKQTVDFPFIFSHQSPLSQAPLDRFFSSYWMLLILVNFLGHQLQYEQPQTQGVLVNTENFNTAKATIVTKVLINFIHNPGNPGRLNRIFLYLLDGSLQVISMQLQFFFVIFPVTSSCHESQS